MKNYTIVVTGRVQGVFFRASTQEQADRLGLRGWVRNEADGSVRMEAEGEETALREFMDWCKQGPSRAEVAHVTTKAGEIKHYSDFVVRR